MKHTLTTLAAAATLTLAAAAPAHAADYRYWSLRHGEDGKWTTTTVGPGSYRPEDGAVEGWRFAVFQEATKDSVNPRAKPDFEAVCGTTPKKAGAKRVALVLDFGTAKDAPSGEQPPAVVRKECVQLPPDATTAEALAKAVPPLRYGSGGLLCAIAGYPRKGCADVVGGERGESPKATGDGDSGDGNGGGPSAGLLVGGGLVVALGGAALWQVRRRRADG
ncbi:SCO2322 family protein [Streptomyces boninensis]|uniref:SCO2322 family protein n=1 Tax=Streptomyces boninensis TaxID=2039455 RepID=UPI003B2134F8